MALTIFTFDLKVRSRSGQKYKILKFIFVSRKYMIMIQFDLRILMVCLVFVYDVQKCQNFQKYKNDVTTWSTYLSHLGVKNRAIDLKFCMLTAYMWFSNIYSVFLKIFEILDFIDIGSSKISFLDFWRSKLKNYKLWYRWIFNLGKTHFLTILICVLL